MKTIKQVLEFIIVTVVFYALYSLSLVIHSHFFKEGDPALYVFLSFVVSLLLIILYRFTVSHTAKKHARKEVHQLYAVKEMKENILKEKMGNERSKLDEAEEKKDEKRYEEERKEK